MLSNTWLLTSRKLNIPHYNLFKSDRSDSYGDVAIPVHSSLKVRLIDINLNLKQSFCNNKIDIISIVLLDSSNTPFSVWSCYIPNDAKIPNQLWVSLFQLTCNRCFIGVYFNSHHLAWGFTFAFNHGNAIYDTVNFLGLCILNSGAATHQGRPNCSNSTIDISFSSPNLVWFTTWSVAYDPHGRDYFPNFISISPNIRGSNTPSIPTNLNNLPNLSSFPQFNLNKAN